MKRTAMSIGNICSKHPPWSLNIQMSNVSSIRNNLKSHSSNTVKDLKGQGARSFEVSSNLKNLSRYGLSEQRASEMLRACPELGKLSESELWKTAEAWARLKFGEAACARLMAKRPRLLALPGDRVEPRCLKLASRFAHRQLYKLVLNSPNAMTDDWASLERRLAYLLDGVKVTKADVVNSGALQHPFERIADRFGFLVRAGLYKIPNGKESPESRFKNPKTVDILNTSDRHFSTVVAGLSLFEFRVFQQLQDIEDSDDD